jgi:hypothetical protein
MFLQVHSFCSLNIKLSCSLLYYWNFISNRIYDYCFKWHNWVILLILIYIRQKGKGQMWLSVQTISVHDFCLIPELRILESGTESWSISTVVYRLCKQIPSLSLILFIKHSLVYFLSSLSIYLSIYPHIFLLLRLFSLTFCWGYFH